MRYRVANNIGGIFGAGDYIDENIAKEWCAKMNAIYGHGTNCLEPEPSEPPEPAEARP